MVEYIESELTGFTFNGAAEYRAFQGMRDSFYNLVQDPVKELEYFPMQKSSIFNELAECYLLGFYLGLELRSDYEKEDQTTRLDPFRYRATNTRDNGSSRSSMGGLFGNDVSLPDDPLSWCKRGLLR